MRRPSYESKNDTAREQRRTASDPHTAAFGGAAHTLREKWGLPAQQNAVAEPRRGVPAYALLAIVALALALAVLMQLLFRHAAANPSATYELSVETFVDDSLLVVIAPLDSDGDGLLSPAEAAAVTELDCSGLGLRSLAGIELFTNLEVLDASDNLLGAIDLANLTHLREVNLSNNNLDELDMSNHNSLQHLDVSNNNMGSLGLSGCTGLVTLLCTGNDLARLDLTDCVSLSELACDDGQSTTVPITEGFFPDAALRAALTALDVEGDGALSLRERQNATKLVVNDPTLESLDGLAWVEGLLELDVSGTALTSLEAHTLPASLISLNASGCSISHVDLGGVNRLTKLDLSSNPLTLIDLGELPRLTELYLADCLLAGSLDITSNSRLTTVDVRGNANLYEVDTTGVAGLVPEGSVACDEACTVLHEQPIEEPHAAQTENPQEEEAA